jgi:hypothetical protein
MERLKIIDSGRRRRFSKAKKLQIVAESYLEPGLCATTARRDGISRSQLYEWRRLAAWQLEARLTWALSRHCLFLRQGLQQDRCRRQVGLRLSAQMATV